MKEQYRGTPQGMTAINQIQKEINKLEGIYPSRKIMLQGDEDKPLVINNSADRELRIKQLIEKATKIG